MNTKPKNDLTRRKFISHTSTAALSAACFGPFMLRGKNLNSKVNLAAIGAGGKGSSDTDNSARCGANVVALCDVDTNTLRSRGQKYPGAATFQDFRKMFDKMEKSIDAVTVSTPDHMHAIAGVQAMKMGKHVYVQKPLTQSVYEARLMAKVAKEQKVATQMGNQGSAGSGLRRAVQVIQSGLIGAVTELHVWSNRPVWPQGIDRPKGSDPVPDHLNWDLWQGQTPDTPYIQERCHYTFRWWYAYSGGQMTDWGAHHLDIAQWGINSHPVEITGTAKYPTVENGFDVAVDFHATYKYANGVTMNVADNGRNGIMFNGSEGRIFVNRGTIAGKPVEDLESNPLPREDFAVYDYDNLERPPRAGKLDAITNHMGNFFDCIAARRDPISDVESQHRSVTTCHLGNIAMRVGRTLKWDPESETFPDDADAKDLMRRDQRDGYEVS